MRTCRAGRRIASRFWTRHYSLQPLETRYSYDANTAELTFIDYKGDEATPDVSLRYNRLGQIATVIDAVGTQSRFPR